MKKLKVLGVAGVLSLAMGTSVFAADFSGGGSVIGHHMNPAACVAGNYVKPLAGMTAAQCNFGNCNLICGNWGEYCRNYVETANLAVNDSYADVAVSESSYTDVAVYDSYAESAVVYDDYSTDYGYGNGYGGNYVDADNDGVCDNWQSGGYGGGYGNGYCGGYGNGGGYGGGHHGGGHGRGCNW